jgi:hypothetical protein
VRKRRSCVASVRSRLNCAPPARRGASAGVG